MFVFIQCSDFSNAAYTQDERMSRPVLTHTSEFSVMFPQPGGTQTLTEFDVKWRHWHEEVDRCLQVNSFASNRHLELICKVSEEVLLFMDKFIIEGSVQTSSNSQAIVFIYLFILNVPTPFHLRSFWEMKTLCWITRSCWVPGITFWSRDFSSATPQ